MVTPDVQTCMRMIRTGTPVERIQFASSLADMGTVGHEALAALAADASLPAEVRITAVSELPESADPRLLLALARSLFEASDVVLVYLGIKASVRAGLFELAPSIERLRSDTRSFWDIDREIVISEAAERALGCLRVGEVQRDFE